MGCRVIVILGALFCVTAVFADEAAFAFLKKAASHASQTNYYGVCSYHADGLDGSFRFAHFRDGVDAKNIIETLSWSTPVGKSADKKQSLIIRRGSFLAKLDQFVPEWANLHYDLRLGQEENIADRKAHVLYAMPKDSYRYAHQFWVDEETGLLLGYRILTEEKEVIEEVRCRHLKSVTKPPLQSDTSQAFSDSPKKESVGFIEKVALPRYFPGYDKPLKQLFFTDGFSSFSIFIEDSDTHEPGKDHFSRFGATAKLMTVKNGYKITAVGEVPKRTLEKAIQAILATDVPPLLP